jgi:hypothetical protein
MLVFNSMCYFARTTITWHTICWHTAPRMVLWGYKLVFKLQEFDPFETGFFSMHFKPIPVVIAHCGSVFTSESATPPPPAEMPLCGHHDLTRLGLAHVI